MRFSIAVIITLPLLFSSTTQALPWPRTVTRLVPRECNDQSTGGCSTSVQTLIQKRSIEGQSNNGRKSEAYWKKYWARYWAQNDPEKLGGRMPKDDEYPQAFAEARDAAYQDKLEADVESMYADDDPQANASKVNQAQWTGALTASPTAEEPHWPTHPGPPSPTPSAPPRPSVLNANQAEPPAVNGLGALNARPTAHEYKPGALNARPAAPNIGASPAAYPPGALNARPNVPQPPPKHPNTRPSSNNTPAQTTVRPPSRRQSLVESGKRGLSRLSQATTTLRGHVDKRFPAVSNTIGRVFRRPATL